MRKNITIVKLLNVFLSIFGIWIMPIHGRAITINSEISADFNPNLTYFKDSLCLGVKFQQGEPISNLKNLTELNVKWVREEFPWEGLESAPGQWANDFPDYFMQRLKYYREHDIGVIFLLGYGNSKAYPNSKLNPANSVDAKKFADFATHATQFLKRAKVRFALEILNEPHNHLPKLLGGNWQGAAPSTWVDHYARMVRETVSAVHALDPNIKLLTDDDMWIVHYWFLEAGLPSEISGFAIHPYTRIPEITAVAYDTDWTRPFHVVDIDRSFRSAVRRLRDQGMNKLGKVPEIWITEWGWPVDGVKGSVTDQTLTAYLPRVFMLAAAAGVKTTCWFSSNDSVDGPMGLTRKDGSKRDSYYAFRTLSEQLGKFTLVRHLFGADHPTTGIQGFLFENAFEKKLVIWNVEGQSSAMEFYDMNNSSRAVDALGKVIVAKKFPAGKREIQISASPIYLTGKFLDNTNNITIPNILNKPNTPKLNIKINNK